MLSTSALGRNSRHLSSASAGNGTVDISFPAADVKPVGTWLNTMGIGGPEARPYLMQYKRTENAQFGNRGDCITNISSRKEEKS